MNSRERFQCIMHFGIPDRIPVWDLEGIAEQTVRLWSPERLPLGMEIRDYVGFDRDEQIPIDMNPIPNFVPRALEEDEEWLTEIDIYGFKVRVSKKQKLVPRIYYYLEGSVQNRDDWERMKKRYDPHDIRRYPKSWSKELLDYYREADHPIGLTIPWGPGRGPKNGYTMGFERFLETLADEPEFVHDMFSFWADFVIELVKEAVEGAKIDYAYIHEDGLAYKNSTLVSPATYREFWFPYVRKVTDFLRAHGINIIGHYTSGNIEPLIPTFLDAGMNLFAPLECAAGMDAVKLRKQYGREVLLIGNIARQALMSGKEAVEEEFRSKVPYLMEQGGYMPAVDDTILPDISFDSFMHYIALVRSFGFGGSGCC